MMELICEKNFGYFHKKKSVIDVSHSSKSLCLKGTVLDNIAMQMTLEHVLAQRSKESNKWRAKGTSNSFGA